MNSRLVVLYRDRGVHSGNLALAVHLGLLCFFGIVAIAVAGEVTYPEY